MEFQVNTYNVPGGRVVFTVNFSDHYIRRGDVGTLHSIQKNPITGEEDVIVEYLHPVENQLKKITVTWDCIDWL